MTGLLGWPGGVILPEPRRAWETLLGAAHVYNSVHMRGCWALGPKRGPMCTNLYTLRVSRLAWVADPARA